MKEFHIPSASNRLALAGLLFGFLCGCPSPAPSPGGGTSTEPEPGPAATTPTDRPAPTPVGQWLRTRTRLTVELGSPRHSAIDSIVNPGQPARVEGKFTYGKVSKDLEGEEVFLQWPAGDGTFTPVARGVTDADGRVSIAVPADLIRGLGAHPYQFRVSGDGSTADGVLWVLERATKTVVFDIDGTLTTGDSELIDDALGGDIDARGGAKAVVDHWQQTGHVVVFLTGRPYMYNRSTRRWLDAKGFPKGPMATANSIGEAVPSESGVGAFKLAWLKSLVEVAGLDIVAAYGNASTDICAFAKAGIPPASTYIIDNEQTSCAGHDPINRIPDYVQHLQHLLQKQAPKQP